MTFPSPFLARVAVGISLVALVSCGSSRPTGRFEGRYVLEPYGPAGSRSPRKGEFVFQPDRNDPFRFVGVDGTVVAPAAMWTDGGSVPRILAWLPGLGRWHYERSYIVHDWLMTEHRMQQPPMAHSVPFAVEAVFTEALRTEAAEQRFRVESVQRWLIARAANRGPGPLRHWNAVQPDPLKKWVARGSPRSPNTGSAVTD